MSRPFFSALRRAAPAPELGATGQAAALTPRQLLLVSRPALWVNTLGVAVTGLWLSGHLWSASPGWWLLLLYLTLPYNLLIYGLNDLSDRAEDALNPRKGGWQGARLHGGETGALLRAIALTNAPFLLALALLLPAPAFLLLLLCAGLFAGYSLPPLRFKVRPLLDGLSNVAYALPLALPALTLGGPLPVLATSALCCYAAGKHAFDAAQDVPSDEAAGVRTTATLLGVRGAALYALGWFALGAALLWPLSRLSSAALLLVCGGMALALAARPSARRAGRLYPLSIVSPWLVGGVSGVQLVYLLVRGVL